MGRKLFLLSMALFALLGRSMGHAGDIPVIAAASDLTYALNKVSEQFTEQTGQRVRLSFGSSGNLKRLIEQGAPFEVFMSADEHYVLQLAETGHTRDQGRIYASGRLALFAPLTSPLANQLSFERLSDLAAKGSIRKFSIANPSHAPYGRAAREVLINVKLWDDLEKILVFGESASQATLFAVSGATQGAIIPHSLVLNPIVAEKGRYRLIDQSLHAPLRQRMVLLKGAGSTAEQFYNHLQSTAAQAILREYGFTVSGEM